MHVDGRSRVHRARCRRWPGSCSDRPCDGPNALRPSVSAHRAHIIVDARRKRQLQRATVNCQQERDKMVQVEDASDRVPGQIVTKRCIIAADDAGAIRFESSVRITIESGMVTRSLWWFSDGRPLRLA